jgi:hypothetical protein
MQIADQDIGGARVRRVFTARGEVMRPQRHLSADEVLAMPLANRRALQEAGYLEVYPRSSPAGKGPLEKRFLMKVGDGQYDVIAGHKLNPKPLSRAEADRLAHGSNGSK